MRLVQQLVRLVGIAERRASRARAGARARASALGSRDPRRARERLAQVLGRGVASVATSTSASARFAVDVMRTRREDLAQALLRRRAIAGRQLVSRRVSIADAVRASSSSPRAAHHRPAPARTPARTRARGRAMIARIANRRAAAVSARSR